MALIFGIIGKLLAHMVLDECRYNDGNNTGRQANDKDGSQFYSLSAEQIRRNHRGHGGRHGTAGDAQRGSDHREAHRTLGPCLVGLGDLTDDGQQTVAGMCRAGKDAKGKTAQRAIVRDMVGMAAKKQRGTPHEIFQSARSLQGCRGCDDGKDDQHHVDGSFSGSQTKNIDEDKGAKHAIDAQAYAAHARTDENEHQDDKQFYQYEGCCHISFAFRFNTVAKIRFSWI